MADKQIYQLNPNTAPPLTYVIAVQHPAGSFEAEQTTLTQFKAALSLNLTDNTSDATKNAASVTLTNKTISLSNNTFSGTLAQFNTSVTDADLASLAGVETLTNKTMSGASNTFTAIPQSAIVTLVSDLSGKQPLDSDLTAIAAIAPSNDDIIQRKAGAWINRTMTQLKTDLALAISDTSGLQAALDLKAALLSPAFTGNPTAPTQAPADNSTRIATTQYVAAAIAAGGGGGSLDLVPTNGSTNGVQSNGVFDSIATRKPIQVITQASHGFTVLMAVKRNTSGTWIRCRATPTSNLSYADGLVSSVVDANTFILGQPGDVVDATGLGLATDTPYYMDTTSSGINYTATAPSAIGDVYKELFKTNAANQAYIMNWPGFEITTATSGSGGGGKYWRYQQWEHFTLPPQTTVNGSTFVHATGSGTTGAGFTTMTSAPSTMTGYLGVVTGSTGTVATGWASIGMGNYPNNFRFDGNAKIRYMAKLYIDTLRDGTDDYRIVVGFSDGVGNGNLPADGAYFIYSSANAAWQYVTSANSVRTTNTSSVTVSALTTYILEIEFDGAGGFNFYINGALANVSPITTNTPVGVANATAHGVIITKTAGVTARTVNVDWIALGIDFE
jgi:hypothetical protein